MTRFDEHKAMAPMFLYVVALCTVYIASAGDASYCPFSCSENAGGYALPDAPGLLNQNTTYAEDAVAIGAGTFASGYHAIAIGFGTCVGTCAPKSGTNATGEGSVAIGQNVLASATNAMAFGAGVNATADNSLAMGTNTVSSGEFATSFGATARRWANPCSTSSAS